MRQAAFEHVRALNDIYDDLTSDDLRAGFQFEGKRFPLVNPQRGIFKPREMRFTLSIRTVYPRPGAKIWYDDQTRVHQQLFASADFVDYAFMGSNPDAADNRGLREAYEHRVPLLYFVGIAPGRYLPQIAYIAGWDALSLKARVGFGYPSRLDAARFPDSAPAREYAIRAVKQRLHQATFRQAVLTAYDGRCALSGLPEIRLLDAAHIIRDGDERLGQPLVTNGIPLTKLHHAAFDSHLIGIDPDFKLHVSRRLLLQRDGPMLEALKSLDGQTLRLPPRVRDRPDRDRLSMRYSDFVAAA
ncbi:MAG: HNH endonuclease [Lysobacteraceae bacterium]|nr:MAG: HNH endonuclease [Xanthomonadaceae bacterium]